MDLGTALSQDMTVETRCCEDNGACAEWQVHRTAHVEAHCNDGMYHVLSLTLQLREALELCTSGG